MENLWKQFPILERMREGREVVWINPGRRPFAAGEELCGLSARDIEDAETRLRRFAPFIMKRFPETRDRDGLIESELTPIPRMRDHINRKYRSGLAGRLLLKQDNRLAIAGSVKARGGIYEVLKHTEDLALEHGLLAPSDHYAKLADPACRKFFERYTVQVGSTGNLGLSIGIMSAAIGYQVTVHMSADAKQWKKDLLRRHGVTVQEYESDYSEAVRQGRRLSDENPNSYFVDDENSKDLFLGYAAAAGRLAAQLREQGIAIGGGRPLFVYIPCGVGGAPGGITFGLKQLFGEHVHCFFVEPVQAPCMLAGMATGLDSRISVQDVGLTGRTHADGLAVGRPSGLVGQLMRPLLSGEFTVQDPRLYDYMRDLWDTEGIFLEPSACAAFQGVVTMNGSGEVRRYLEENGIADQMENAVHVAWATGGSLVPEDIREEYRQTYL